MYRLLYPGKRRIIVKKGESAIKKVVDDASIISELAAKYDTADIYISAYAMDSDMIDRVLFDIDVGYEEKQIEVAYKQMKILVSRLENLGVKPLVLFTGGRGFHIYAFCEPVVLERPREALRKFAEKIAGDLNIDMCVTVGINRVIRAPYTRHSRTKLFCIPVDPDWSLEEILKRSRSPEMIEDLEIDRSRVLSEILLKLDAECRQQPRYEYALAPRPKGGYLKLPCVRLIFTHPLPPGARCIEAAKLIALAYYLDHGTSEGFEVYAELFASRQKVGHDLKFDEVYGWMRTLERWKDLYWSCSEVRKWLKEWQLPIPCKKNCPYLIAEREYKEQEEYRRGLELLESGRLLDEVERVLDLKVVGETSKKVLLYLLLLGFENIIIKGATSSGKNHLTDSVISLFPQDKVLVVTAVTPRMLRWQTGDIDILYIREIPEERIRTADEVYWMDVKQAMSDHEIVFHYVDMNSRATKVRRIAVGAVVQTTNLLKLPEDYENRCWIIPTDPSKRLTERVKERVAEEWRTLDKSTIDLRAIRSANRILLEISKRILRSEKLKFGVDGSIKVVIPAAHTLRKMLKCSMPRARRDIKKLMWLAVAIALTDVSRRLYRDKQDGKLVIVVASKDIVRLHQLLRDVAYVFTPIEPRIIDAWNAMRDLESNLEEVTASSLARSLNISQDRARQLLNALVAYGFAEVEKQGNKNVYRSRDVMLESVIDPEIDYDKLREEEEEWWMENGERLEKASLYDLDFLSSLRCDSSLAKRTAESSVHQSV